MTICDLEIGQSAVISAVGGEFEQLELPVRYDSIFWIWV